MPPRKSTRYLSLLTCVCSRVDQCGVISKSFFCRVREQTSGASSSGVTVARFVSGQSRHSEAGVRPPDREATCRGSCLAAAVEDTGATHEDLVESDSRPPPAVITAMPDRSGAWEPGPRVFCALQPEARPLLLSVKRAVACGLSAAATRGPALSPGFQPVSGRAGPSPQGTRSPGRASGAHGSVSRALPAVAAQFPPLGREPGL